MKVKRAIFVVSTYGVGGPTNDAKKFAAWFENLSENNQLSDMSFTVFALGNSTFEKFAGYGKSIDAKLESLGAKRVFPLGTGNAAEDTTDGDFESWKDSGLWSSLNAVYPLTEQSVKSLREESAGIIISENISGSECDWEKYSFEEGVVEGKLREYFEASSLKINEIKELRSTDPQCLHIDLASTGFEYTTSGNLGVYP